VKEDVRRAYATLGLPTTASPAEVRRAYKQLVKQWHPDRFAADPNGQAEAAPRMRDINAAYRTVRGAYIGTYESTTAADGRVRPVPTPGARLSREQIDEMVNSIGRDSPIDVMFGALSWYAAWIRLGLGLLAGAWAVARTVHVARRPGLADFWDYAEVPLFVLLVLVVSVATGRRRPGRPAG
jgi:hypothetical protein